MLWLAVPDNEKLRDLLTPADFDAKLKVREDPKKGVVVHNQVEVVVNSHDDIENLMDEGTSNRVTAATAMNAQSSRSHAVFVLRVTQSQKEDIGGGKFKVQESMSKIAMIDLAGSESQGKTGAKGARLTEGANINKSLTCFGRVISALVKASNNPTKQVHVPFRDSQLTWLLKDCVGGNSKTAILVCISPADFNRDESITTLRFAQACKKVRTKPVVQKVFTTRSVEELLEAERKAAEGLSDESNPMASIRSRRLKARKVMGAEDAQPETPYLLNHTADPMTSGSLKIFLIKGKSFTMGDCPDADLEIAGLNIQNIHCGFACDAETGAVTVRSMNKRASVCKNGERIPLPKDDHSRCGHHMMSCSPR